METKLQPSITGTRVNLIKGASQKDINDNTNLTKQYMDETKAYRDEANIINNSIAILNDETIYNADMAYKWSSNPIEVEVTTGKYSAYHWAYKANEAANIAINIIDDINISTLKSYSNSKVNDLLGDKAFLNNPKFTNHISFGNSILSNWAGSLKVIEANGSTFFGSNGISALTGSNAYYDGNWRYKTDGSAGLQLVNQGSHQFIVAASGLSNDIISWNTILTVDNNGVNSDSLVNKTSQTGSIIMPSSSTLNRDNVPLDGYTRHNTTLKNLEYYGNSKWNIITDNLKIVNSVSELKLLDGNVYVNCIVNGYYIKGDGGGGNFYWDSTSTEVDNGGTIIQATNITTGRWKRVFSGAVNIKWFGAKGDGVTDDTVAVQNGLNFSSISKQILQAPSGKYLITDTIYIPEGGQIIGETLYQYGKGFGIDPKATSIIFKPTSLKSLFVFNGTLHGGFRFHNSIQNLYLEGNSSSSTGNSNYAIEVDKIIYGTFKNISIDKSFRVGIKCDGTINNRFENIYTTGFIQAVEYIGNTETTDVWEQCSFWGSPKGVRLNGTTIGLRFNNCLIEQLDDYGFDISATTANMIVSNLYSEDVPFANNVPDNSVFRVGGFGTSAKSSIQLTVSNSNIRGNNTTTIGSAIYAVDTDGICVNNTFIRKFTNAINTTSATRTNSVWLNNVVFTACTNTITDTTKTGGNYSSQLTDASLIYHQRCTKLYSNEIRPHTATSLLLYNATTALTFSANNLYPSTDNLMTLGLSNQRFSTIYAGTGTINTSDDREKTYLEITEVEKQVALELKANMRKFKFNDAIKTKGEDKARIHYGTSAQGVIEVFEKHGLNAMDYAMICYDEWQDEYETTVIEEAVLDSEGNILEEEVTEQVLVRKAGDRYGIRYEELLCFIIGAM